MLEEWTTHTSYDMGLETERAALEKLATHNVLQEPVTAYIYQFLNGLKTTVGLGNIDKIGIEIYRGFNMVNLIFF